MAVVGSDCLSAINGHFAPGQGLRGRGEEGGGRSRRSTCFAAGTGRRAPGPAGYACRGDISETQQRGKQLAPRKPCFTPRAREIRITALLAAADKSSHFFNFFFFFHPALAYVNTSRLLRIRVQPLS